MMRMEIKQNKLLNRPILLLTNRCQTRCTGNPSTSTNENAAVRIWLHRLKIEKQDIKNMMLKMITRVGRLEAFPESSSGRYSLIALVTTRARRYSATPLLSTARSLCSVLCHLAAMCFALNFFSAANSRYHSQTGGFQLPFNFS